MDPAAHHSRATQAQGPGHVPRRDAGSCPDDADERRRAAREGRDLDDERAPQKPETFREAFEVLLALKRKQLSNAKHLAQWSSTMETYVFPKLGKRPVADITPRDILDVMEPIWFTVPETASRVLQRLSSVFEHSILRQTRKHADPTGGVKKALGSDTRKSSIIAPYPSMTCQPLWRSCARVKPYRASASCSQSDGLRSQEARRAEWCEIDLDNRLWTVPAAKMKARRPHTVPLSTAAVELLKKMRASFPRAISCSPHPLAVASCQMLHD